MNRTKIDYLTHTWSPIAMRCTPVSAGCANCWHLSMARRHAGNHTLRPEMREARAGGKPWLNPEELGAPLRLRKPAVIGVQFMGDLFHESVTYEQIWPVLTVIGAVRESAFVVLTKRPGRMAEVFDWWGSGGAARVRVAPGGPIFEAALLASSQANVWPLPNLWLGVSVEDQKTADERIPILLGIPAAVRWVSYESALGRADLNLNMRGGISWVVAGAETGPGKRPADLGWFRRMRDQCAAAGIPFFFKVDSAGNHELDGKIHEQLPEV